MLNYIRAELYKATHRVYTWIMLALILLGEGFMFLVWFDQRDYMTFYQAVSVVGLMMVIGFIATIFTCDIVFAGQHQNGTLKNEVSFGLSRAKIYWGKFITMIILSLAAMVIALGVYLGVCRLMLSNGDGGALAALELIGLAVLAEFPVWLGCQAIICAASFLLNSAIVANVMAFGIVIGSHFAIELIVVFMYHDNPVRQLLYHIYHWLPYEPLFASYPGVANLQTGPTPAIREIDWIGIRNCWIIGGFWLIFATAVGLHFFRKKEIK